MSTIKPILRIFDYDKTIEFYVDWLGFKVDWINEFEKGVAPKFMQVTLKDVVLYLSEHHGDGSPGVHITVNDFEGLRAYHQLLIDKKYKYNGPGLEIPFWNENAITMTVIDPVGNQITFTEVVK
ncbi:glyoxalase superfamily protein [Mucilaginibacter sp. X4EP1]|uniref:glyoxalase superfamily protein n=1 Tax=Mucilaginibacter sp. X4EP1 TaxID=2723092 RepID=UPI002168D6D8|nr:glyoxalase superfamily protein [Mucilaginibacter sp. X4EP1]MCS3813604.1 catechol 2,3-dioxygenase-like lactoylglutathione lyase family enzyme [Mucilaginibacter sp. X4EP1]